MTHINAYYQDVEQKKGLVQDAQNGLKAAEEALKAHPDYVAPKKEVKVEKLEPDTAKPAEEKKPPMVKKSK